MTSFQHIVTKAEQNRRIDKLLTEIFADASRAQIQKWIIDGFVIVNNHPVKANYRCQENDQIHWTVPKEKELIIRPENIPLEIIYEDKDLLIVNKPKGMVVHPTNEHQAGTLVNALRYYTNQLSQIGGKERPGIVHRIDKETSGLLVVAKNDQTHQLLVKQFKRNEVERTYEAIVHGVMNHDHGLIDAPIGRDPNNRLRMAVVDGGKQAITHFKVIKRYYKFTHIMSQLETGRTHQIRVHMNYIGHPLVGDEKYASGRSHIAYGQALFAKKLSFVHPSTNDRLCFEIEQPDDFKNTLLQIEKES